MNWNAEEYSRLQQKAAADPAFRQALLADPGAALAAAGVVLAQELTDAELEAIAGGNLPGPGDFSAPQRPPTGLS